MGRQPLRNTPAKSLEPQYARCSVSSGEVYGIGRTVGAGPGHWADKIHCSPSQKAEVVLLVVVVVVVGCCWCWWC